MGAKKRQLEALKQAFDEHTSKETLYKKQARVIPHTWSVQTGSLTFPNVPCIAVQAANESESAHARIFIALRYTGPSPGPQRHANWPSNDFIYRTTDLVQIENNPAAKINLEDARTWAQPGLSKTWQISQARAENALAVAMQFTRVQSFWSGSPSGGISEADHRALGEFHDMDEVLLRRGTILHADADARAYLPPHVPVKGQMLDKLTEFKLTADGKVVGSVRHLANYIPRYKNKVRISPHKGRIVVHRTKYEVSGRKPYPRDPSYKYGLKETFRECINPRCWIGGQKREYMTCATYAEILLKAAGVEAPFSLGQQSALNMVKYDRNVPQVLARMKAYLGSSAKSLWKKSRKRTSKSVGSGSRA